VYIKFLFFYLGEYFKESDFVEGVESEIDIICSKEVYGAGFVPSGIKVGALIPQEEVRMYAVRSGVRM